MIRLTTIIAALLLAVLLASASNVLFNLADFTTATITNRVVMITPQSTPMASGTNIISSDRIRYATDTNGQFTVTNMIGPATYKVELLGAYATTPFFITLTNGSASVNAKDFISTATNTTVYNTYLTAIDQRIAAWFTNSSVTFGAGTNSYSVTNSLAALTSFFWASIATDDATADNLRVIPATGYFTIKLKTAPTASTIIHWFMKP